MEDVEDRKMNSKIKLVDVHCHLTLLKHKKEVLDKISNDMEFAVTSGIDVKDGKKSLDLAKQSNNVFITLGFSPVSVPDSNQKEYFDFVNETVGNPKLVGIGEVGLDYYWEKIPARRKVQMKFFIKAIELANDLKKVLVIHTRDAFDDTIKTLERHTPNKFFIHSFRYGKSKARRIIDLGGYISLSTAMIKFPNDYTKLIKVAPLEYMLTETDSPYLSPDKGDNVPWNVEKSIKMIARIKEMEPEEVSKQVEKNAKNVFGIR